MSSMTSSFSPHYGRQRQRGMSMVELLIGAAIGLLLATWAISAFVSSLGNNRTLMVEAHVNQGLRAAADLIARDLRRAGYWENAISGTITGTGALSGITTANPYTAVSNSGTSVITYNFARDTDNTLNSNEQFGFKLDDGMIKMRTEADPETWVAITDSQTLTVTALDITSSETDLDIAACSTLCVTNCPSVKVRSYGIVLRGRSVKDAAIDRTLRTNVRVRNEALSGVCPA